MIYRLSRKTDVGTYVPLRTFTEGDLLAGGIWTYNDMALDGSRNYTYIVEALDCRNAVIASSYEVSLTNAVQRQPKRSAVRINKKK
jgi:hypothetical protein